MSGGYARDATAVGPSKQARRPPLHAHPGGGLDRARALGHDGGLVSGLCMPVICAPWSARPIHMLVAISDPLLITFSRPQWIRRMYC